MLTTARTSTCHCTHRYVFLYYSVDKTGFILCYVLHTIVLTTFKYRGAKVRTVVATNVNFSINHKAAVFDSYVCLHSHILLVLEKLVLENVETDTRISNVALLWPQMS